MIKNVLLDWSGTLADDLSAVLKATNLIFAEYGRDPLTLEGIDRAMRELAR